MRVDLGAHVRQQLHALRLRDAAHAHQVREPRRVAGLRLPDEDQRVVLVARRDGAEDVDPPRLHLARREAILLWLPRAIWTAMETWT